MLNSVRPHHIFHTALALSLGVMVYTAVHQELFVDEAFYWLEGQYPDWSYAELPGWTQWIHALTSRLLPDHPFFMRLPGLLAFASLPYLAMGISRLLHGHQQSHAVGVLMLCLPMLTLAGTLAIPDIWLVWFGLLAVWLLAQFIHTQHRQWAFLLGLALAAGSNVHIRFWPVVLIAATVTLIIFRQHKPTVKGLLTISLPIMCLGFLPIIWFNLQHDFVMFSFQLTDRHPWNFQTSHFSFLLMQMLVTTPLVFVLCVALCQHTLSGQGMIRVLSWMALLHWLLYATTGFFTDNLRFNWHWPLRSK